MSGPTLHDTLADALDAYDRLGLLGEEIEDEWSYVTELGAAWRERLEQVDAIQDRAVERGQPLSERVRVHPREDARWRARRE